MTAFTSFDLTPALFLEIYSASILWYLYLPALLFLPGMDPGCQTVPLIEKIDCLFFRHSGISYPNSNQ